MDWIAGRRGQDAGPDGPGADLRGNAEQHRGQGSQARHPRGRSPGCAVGVLHRLHGQPGRCSCGPAGRTARRRAAECSDGYSFGDAAGSDRRSPAATADVPPPPPPPAQTPLSQTSAVYPANQDLAQAQAMQAYARMPQVGSQVVTPAAPNQPAMNQITVPDDQGKEDPAMESLEPVTTRQPGTPAGSRTIRGLAALSAVCLILASGCTTLDVGLGCGDGPPRGDVRSVQVRWFPEIASAPDSTRGGAENKGIVGRLYLSGAIALKECYEAEGDVTVFLYNDSVPVEQGMEQTPMEGWKIDRVTLQKLARKDVVGWGYTLFLPWSSYRPDVTRVHMKLQYDRPKGGSHCTRFRTRSALNPVEDGQYSTAVTHAPGAQMQRFWPSARTTGSCSPGGAAFLRVRISANAEDISRRHPRRGRTQARPPPAISRRSRQV